MNLKPISIVIPYSRSGDEFHVWLQRRESSDDLKGLLEFPGGKIEKHESPVAAAQRELAEETGANAKAGDLKLFNIYTHSYPSATVGIYAFLLSDPHKKLFAAAGWRAIDKNWRVVYKDRIPAANQKVFNDLHLEFIK